METTTWYKLKKDRTNIEEIPGIQRETAHFIWINNIRVNKRNTWETYFSSFKEAKETLLTIIDNERLSLLDKLNANKMANQRVMQVQESTSERNTNSLKNWADKKPGLT